MTEQKQIYEPKKTYEPEKVWQTTLETWFANKLYYVRIFDDFVVISPKNGKKELTVYSTGRVTISEENGEEYDLKPTNKNSRNKRINLLE